MLKNTEHQYGWLAKTIHWLVALTVFGLFGVGLWMVDLTYYSEWYKLAPHYHKSVGILLIILMVYRVFWRSVNVKPVPPENHTQFEKMASHTVHIVLYIIIFGMFVSGYLISTADGRGIEVFNWFEIPSAGEFIENQEDIAGAIHEWLAYSLIGLVVIHAGAALKHHFIDKDITLKRML